MIRHAAPARVGILGNPSDGYGGRTLALAVPRFSATVELEPADGIEIVGRADDEPRWPSLTTMVERLDRHGYGTGPSLLAATVRTFVSVARSVEHDLAGQGFRLSYDTTIPRQVGLAGSSALVVATLRCLSEYYALVVPDEVLPSLALRVETEELGLSAGLQDRVAQTYGGLVAMDFGREIIDARFGVAHGAYERVDPAGLPPLFLAYRETAAEPSDTYHQRLRANFDAGEPTVRDTLRELAGLVVEGRAALRWSDGEHFAELIGRNMELRQVLGPVPESQSALVELAGLCDSPATFAGSGGAVVGAYRDEDQLTALRNAYDSIGADLVVLTGSEHDDPGIDTEMGERSESDDANVVAFPAGRMPGTPPS